MLRYRNYILRQRGVPTYHQLPYSGLLLRNFSTENPHSTFWTDPGIELDTICTAVTDTTIAPPRQSN